jgi:hypothetical protein
MHDIGETGFRLAMSSQYLSLFQTHIHAACCLLQAGVFISLFFDLDDGGDIFLRNVGYIPEDKSS